MRPFAIVALLVTACGGSSAPDERSQDTLFTSAGGERDPTSTNAPPPISTGPAPLPIPTPPVPRGAMSPALQQIWTRAEELLAEGPPPAPEGDANVEEWTATTLGAWLRGRTEAVSELTDRLGGLEGAPLYERALGAALLGTVIEDLVADVRGAPVPASITSDPELFGIYRSSLDGLLGGIAERAAASYQFCAASLDEHGDPAWGEWRAFCFEEAEGLAETYGDAGAEDGGDD